jgi:hypothetical protein
MSELQLRSIFDHCLPFFLLFFYSKWEPLTFAKTNLLPPNQFIIMSALQLRSIVNSEY